MEKIGVSDTVEALNMANSTLYRARKTGVCSKLMELAATDVWNERYPESSDPEKKHIWMVKVPDDQTDVLAKLLTALGCKFSRFIS